MTTLSLPSARGNGPCDETTQELDAAEEARAAAQVAEACEVAPPADAAEAQARVAAALAVAVMQFIRQF